VIGVDPCKKSIDDAIIHKQKDLSLEKNLNYFYGTGGMNCFILNLRRNCRKWCII